jgi:peptide-methionine (R)-S-oxide reductase
MPDKTYHEEKHWIELLSPDQYKIARCGGTEPPFDNAFWNNHKEGVYRCVCCGQDLFSSSSKYDSGSGWPSFFEPIAESGISTREDYSLRGMPRIEALCSNCNAHLGHIFDDGPEPTGLRYCINSGSLSFVEAQKE